MPLLLSLSEFKNMLTKSDPVDLARAFVFAESVHALPDEEAYKAFRKKVKTHVQAAEHIYIVGSGNWRYSLNPDKHLSEYHSGSDIDVAVISCSLYHDTWDEMRRFQREKWYLLDGERQRRLARNGQNVYSGFACPAWIPQLGHTKVYQFKSMLNQLSGPEIGHREVKMMFFKDETEMIDYYRRGFTNAKKGLTA
jgi:hypothetical protein